MTLLTYEDNSPSVDEFCSQWGHQTLLNLHVPKAGCHCLTKLLSVISKTSTAQYSTFKLLHKWISGRSEIET